MTRTIALIPARYAATRFPAKLMQQLAGEPVIWHTYRSARDTGLFDDVIVVCDHEAIFEAIESRGGKAMMSRGDHSCGTDRIAEALERLPDADIIVNVQGDEPFTQKGPLEKLLRVFEGETGKEVQVASLMQELKDPLLVQDPNYVKVTVGLSGDALFFSRSPIPYLRDPEVQVPYYEHIGIYAFRRATLLRFSRLAPTPLEMAEKIECLRYLEHGIPMKMVVTDYMGIEIDTPDDLANAERHLGQGQPIK